MENISLICACKNRKEALRVSLSSWISFKEISEIIIVDWSSDDPIRDLLIFDDRIKIIEVKNKKYFNQSQPLNLASKIATGKYILKMDCDYIINPYYDFFSNYFVDENSFLCGNHSEGIDPVYTTSPYFDYLKGLLLVTRENFLKVGGFNETLTKCYAFEDSELYARFDILGLERKTISYDYNLIHIPHPDKKRIENFEGFPELGEILEQIKPLGLSEKKIDYIVAQEHIKRNWEQIGEVTNYYVDPITKWNIKKNYENLYFAFENR